MFSICIKDTPSSKMKIVGVHFAIFRDIFFHIKLKEKVFELPSSEIYPQNS